MLLWRYTKSQLAPVSSLTIFSLLDRKAASLRLNNIGCSRISQFVGDFAIFLHGVCICPHNFFHSVRWCSFSFYHCLLQETCSQFIFIFHKQLTQTLPYLKNLLFIWSAPHLLGVNLIIGAKTDEISPKQAITWTPHLLTLEIGFKSFLTWFWKDDEWTASFTLLCFKVFLLIVQVFNDLEKFHYISWFPRVLQIVAH